MKQEHIMFDYDFIWKYSPRIYLPVFFTWIDIYHILSCISLDRSLNAFTVLNLDISRGYFGNKKACSISPGCPICS